MPREVASDELSRLIAITKLIGYSTFDRATLVQLASASRRLVYGSGETLPLEEASHGMLRLRLAGDLQLERGGRFRTVRNRFLELVWLARDERLLPLSTSSGVEVLELPYDVLEELIDERFATWIEIARLVAKQLHALPAEARQIHAPGGATLSQRLSALRIAMPFASTYVDALMQLDREASVVRVDPDVAPWSTDLPVEHIFVPLDGELIIHGDDAIAGVGAIDLIGSRPRAGVRTWRQAWSALRVPREVLFDLLEDHPALARDLLAALAKEALRRLESRETQA